MKKLATMCVLCILISLSGCKYKNEAYELQKQNQDLTTQLAKCDSLSNVYRSTLKEIEGAFDSVIPEDNALTPTGKKLSTRLTSKLDEVDHLLLEKEKNIKALNYKLFNLNKKISEMTAKIEDLNSKNRELEKANLHLNKAVTKLEKQITEQSSQIESLILEKQKLNEALETINKAINSAYFIAGNEEELRDKAIIERIGGFLGFLGRVNAINPKIDINQLEMIDIREKSTFTLNAEKRQIEIVSKHHPESYELNDSSNGTTLLTITDPAKFWRSSKCLVITF